MDLLIPIMIKENISDEKGLLHDYPNVKKIGKSSFESTRSSKNSSVKSVRFVNKTPSVIIPDITETFMALPEETESGEYNENNISDYDSSHGAIDDASCIYG